MSMLNICSDMGVAHLDFWRPSSVPEVANQWTIVDSNNVLTSDRWLLYVGQQSMLK